jgi:hypothetical protein
MNRDWHRDLEFQKPPAAALLPPAMVEETGWDILLALRADRAFEISLDKLASLVSVPLETLTQWLVRLEGGRLVAGRKHGPRGQLHAVLTRDGRDLIDSYLSTTSGLQAATQH